MIQLVLVAVGFSFLLYLAVFFYLSPMMKGVLLRHPMAYMVAELAITIPMMVTLFGAGLIAGVVNMATSSMFMFFLKGYGKLHPAYFKTTLRQEMVNEYVYAARIDRVVRRLTRRRTHRLKA